MSLDDIKKKLEQKKRETTGPGDVKANIVIIDDDEDVLRSLRIVLQRRYNVNTASVPAEGVQLVKDLRPATVIVDIRMPQHDGFWVFREIRKFNGDVPIILQSAYQDQMNVEDVELQYRPYRFLHKGNGLQDFLDAVEGAVRQAEKAGS